MILPRSATSRSRMLLDLIAARHTGPAFRRPAAATEARRDTRWSCRTRRLCGETARRLRRGRIAEINSVSDLDAHDEWKGDLQKQRVRFFDAEAFMATYRDQTEPGTTESFADEIFDAIEPSHKIPGTGLDRLTTALTVAAQTAPASVLLRRRRSESGRVSAISLPTTTA